MMLSLNAHKDRYDLGPREIFGLLAGPISLYARRHWDLMKEASETKTKIGHFLIAVLEGIPIGGALFCLIERIIVFASSCFDRNRQESLEVERHLSRENKMRDVVVSSPYSEMSDVPEPTVKEGEEPEGHGWGPKPEEARKQPIESPPITIEPSKINLTINTNVNLTINASEKQKSSPEKEDDYDMLENTSPVNK